MGIRLLLFTVLFFNISFAEKFNYIQLQKDIPEISDWQGSLADQSFVLAEDALGPAEKIIEYSTDKKKEKLWFSGLREKDSYLSVNFRLYQQGSLDLSGNLWRVLNPKNKDFPENQLYREKFSLSLTKYKKPYSFLSFIMNDSKVNAMWIYSPFIDQVRRVASTNRSDNILGSAFSADDLLLWSDNPANYEIIADEKTSAIYPVLKSELNLAKENDCESVRVPLDKTSEETLYLTKSGLLKFTIINRDLFSVIKRQVIYFNEAGLPLFRFAYDQKDNPYKMLINLASNSNLLHRTIISTKDAKTEIEYLRFTFCTSPPEKAQYGQFDPSLL